MGVRTRSMGIDGNLRGSKVALRMFDWRGLVVLLLTLVGMAVVARGLKDADPLLLFSTEEELRALQEGRLLMAGGAALLLISAGPLVARGRWRSALLLAVSGVAPTLGAYAFPVDGVASLAFLLLAPTALAAALTCTIRPPHQPDQRANPGVGVSSMPQPSPYASRLPAAIGAIALLFFLIAPIAGVLIAGPIGGVIESFVGVPIFVGAWWYLRRREGG